MNIAWPVTTCSYVDIEIFNDVFKKIDKSKKIVIFGAGIRGSIFASLLESRGYNDLVFTDNNKEKWFAKMNEYDILPPESLRNKNDKYNIMISTEGVHGIEEQLTSYGYVQEESFFSTRTNEYESYVNKFFRDYQGEMLLLGDCGLSQISLKDKEYNNIAEMAENLFGKNNIKVLAMHGMGMRSYYHLIKQQIEMFPSIKQVLLMINFEVFTGKHHLLPRTQHYDLLEKVRKERNMRGMETDNEYDFYVRIAKDRSEQLKLDIVPSANRNKTNIKKNIFRMNYMYKFSELNEDAEYLKKIIHLFDGETRILKLFIPPLNYEFGRELLGDLLEKRYNANVAKMKKMMNLYQIEIIDMSYLLKASEFASPETIDETANYDGRVKILKMIRKGFLNDL